MGRATLKSLARLFCKFSSPLNRHASESGTRLPLNKSWTPTSAGVTDVVRFEL